MRKQHNVRRQQPKKDSSKKRVNFDNTRVSKFNKDVQEIDDRDSSKKRVRRTAYGGPNDITWYMKNPDMFKSAANLSWYGITGAQMPNEQYLSGIITANWVPSFGDRFMSTVNTSKDIIYSYTVHANSRNYRYDSVDQMLMILAVSELYCLIDSFKRAYGVWMQYDGQNSYMPEVLMRALGFDATDFREHAAEILFDINDFSQRLSAIWIPNDLSFLTRWRWMESEVYQDSESIKGQMYAYRRAMYYAYDEKTSSKGGRLVPMKIVAKAAIPSDEGYWNVKAAHDIAVRLATEPNGTGYSYGFSQVGMGATNWVAWKAIANFMFDKLLQSQDRGMICGDILNAYGAERILAMPGIEAGYVVRPQYRPEVLWQFENSASATCIPGIVYQEPDVNTLKCAYLGCHATKPVNANQAIGKIMPPQAIMNFHQLSDPIPEQIMIASRLSGCKSYMYEVPGIMYVPTSGSPTSAVQPLTSTTTTWTIVETNQPTHCWGFIPSSTGTEQIVAHYMYTMRTPNASYPEKYSRDYFNTVFIYGDTYSPGEGKLDFAFIKRLYQFDWAPILYNYTGATNVSVEAPLSNFLLYDILAEFDNYSFYSESDLSKLNICALYSEWNIPSM